MAEVEQPYTTSFFCPMCGGTTAEDQLAQFSEEERDRWVVALSVAQARKRAKLSQADLGALIGHSRDYVVKIELAQRSLSADKAVLMARKLGVSVETVLCGALAGPAPKEATDAHFA